MFIIFTAMQYVFRASVIVFLADRSVHLLSEYSHTWRAKSWAVTRWLRCGGVVVCRSSFLHMDVVFLNYV